MPQLETSTQQLKRIIVAVNGPVAIPDIQVLMLLRKQAGRLRGPLSLKRLTIMATNTCTHHGTASR